MKHKELKAIKELITVKTGICFKEEREDELVQKISSRMKYLELSHPYEYQQILLDTNPLSMMEWKEMIACITTGESYFFRDQGQIDLLKNSIFPELIKKRENDRKIRIWSAGCSTGEEPYSLAILLSELIPENEPWNLYLLGTDINEESLVQARKGLFTSWSFRGVNPNLKKRYFSEHKGGWVINDCIKNKVDFRVLNLVTDDFSSPSSCAFDMDLILCRNVLIYFKKNSISHIVEKFSKALREGKYLMTGHGEMLGTLPESLRPVSFSNSVIFKKAGNKQGEKVQPDINPESMISIPVRKVNGEKGDSRNKPHGLPDQPAAPPKTPDQNSSTASEQAMEFFQRGLYPDAIEKAEDLIKINNRDFDAHYIIAHAYANMSQFEKALHYCEKANDMDPLSPKLYFLMAHIEMDRGKTQETKNLLKKVIYLSPSFIAAYLDLGGVYEKEGDTERALKMRLTALELLKGLPKETQVEHYGGMQACELIEELNLMSAEKLL